MGGLWRRRPAADAGPVDRAGQTTILAVGLAAASVSTYTGLDLLNAIGYNKRASDYALAGAAIASPLFGAIAGFNAERWRPLIAGCLLAVAVLAALWVIVVMDALT